MALLFHAFLPLLHAPRAIAATLGGGAEIVLCTPFGLQVMPAPAQPGGDPKEQAPTKIFYCPICAAAQASGSFVSPLAIPFFQPTETSYVQFFTSSARLIRVADRFSQQPRAPPAIA